MDFFTSPEDLTAWVRTQESPDAAATKILEGWVGIQESSNATEGKSSEPAPPPLQDIVETCREIFPNDNENHADNASKILWGVLAKHQLNQKKEGSNMTDKLRKEAQIMRQPGEYDMPLRVCPKLPYSVGKRLISTYNCRHYCLDSLVLDDNPTRVYCKEALWRRHVMDKFAREFKNDEGKWVGGYINSRFQVFHDDGGNQMELANNERTRKPRPHQYSTERRLEEARGEKTVDITASSENMIKLASTGDDKLGEDKVYQIFDDVIDMKEAGISDEDILYKVAEHYDVSIPEVASIQKVANNLVQRNSGVIYSCDHSPKMKKKAQAVSPLNSTMVCKQELPAVNLSDGQNLVLKIETPVVVVDDAGNDSVLEIVDGPDAGVKISVAGSVNMEEAFGMIEDIAGVLQDSAKEVGLNDEVIPVSTKDQSSFSVVDVTPAQ